jgi:hypothetical protein
MKNFIAIFSLYISAVSNHNLFQKPIVFMGNIFKLNSCFRNIHTFRIMLLECKMALHIDSLKLILNFLKALMVILMVSNKLTINLNKIHCVQFKTKNKSTSDLNIVCNNHLITTLSNIKVLGININDSMNWSCHVKYIISKLSSTCYIMRSVKPYMPLNTLKTIYYSYFNTDVSYGLLFWGNSPQSSRIFIMQKKIIRIMTSCNNRVLCNCLFRRLEILPLASQYILSLLCFVINNNNLFTLNSDKCNINLRHTNTFYQPSSNLTTYKKRGFLYGYKGL